MRQFQGTLQFEGTLETTGYKEHDDGFQGTLQGIQRSLDPERMADVMNRVSMSTYKHRPIVQGDRVNSAVTKIACREKGIDPLTLLYLGPTKMTSLSHSRTSAEMASL